MPSPFDYQGLWDKSVLFMTRSHEPGRPFSESTLWASLSFELLGKAALAKISPTLIADPIDDGKSLLLAAGIGSDWTGFRSVQAKTVFSRCARAFRPFNADIATKLAGDRNAELHSAALPYAVSNQDAFWMDFWSQAIILIAAVDKELPDYVSARKVAEVERILERQSQANEGRVKALLGRAAQRFTLVRSGDISARMAKELPGPTLFLQDYSEPHECPACKRMGTISGDYVLDTYDVVEPDDFYSNVELISVESDTFSCDDCGLVLDNAAFVALAGLPTSFDAEREKIFDEPEYMNE